MKTKLLLLAFITMKLSLFSQETKTIQLIGSIENSDIRALRIMHLPNPFDDSEFNAHYFKEIPQIDGFYIEKFESNKPRVGLFVTLNNLGQMVYMTPGDSLSYTVKRDEKNRVVFEFSGRNAAHYNYSFLMARTLTNRPLRYEKGDDILLYKKEREQYRDSKIAFLKNYRLQYPVSDDFYDYAKASIANEYIYNLYLPEYSKQIARKDIPEGYYDKGLVAANSLASLYIPALWNMYLYNYHDDIYNKFDSVYNYIMHDFEGETREYLLSAMIGLYAWKNDPSYEKQLLDVIEKAPRYIQNIECLEYIEKAKMFYTLLNRQIPEDVLNNTFLMEFGHENKQSLKEVLQKFEGKAVYIDFWASWCVPCIRDILDSKESKALLESKDVEYLYIGHKDEAKNWISASEKYGITKNQYLEMDSRQSPLSEYFKITSIPRYILLNKEHKVVNAKAPRPTPIDFHDFKEVVSKLTRVVVWGPR
jgi:thiol-disulfide isomerase/thioredoxin